MQIDFHLGVMYVLSRLAGFTSSEANIIASSSQYVDDAINEGTLFFKNESIYNFISSAHRNLDYRNFEELKNHRVWIPFHFLPANQTYPELGTQVPEFVQKMICRPNSQIAQEVFQVCIDAYNKPYSLYLLGVTCHTFVDTWAHQGFAGISHQVNVAEDIYDADGALDVEMVKRRNKFFKRGLLRTWLEKFLDFIKMKAISEINPIGHGSVLSYPDLPYLIWQYKDWKGDLITRNNPEDFMNAVQEVFKNMCRFRDAMGLPVNSLKEKDLHKIKDLLENLRSSDSMERLSIWKQKIQTGAFSFGSDVWNYQDEGPGCWVHQALGFETSDDFEFKDLEYREAFLNSHWKLAHDALIYHRFKLLYEILPKYGLCAA